MSEAWLEERKQKLNICTTKIGKIKQPPDLPPTALLGQIQFADSTSKPGRRVERDGQLPDRSLRYETRTALDAMLLLRDFVPTALPETQNWAIRRPPAESPQEYEIHPETPTSNTIKTTVLVSPSLRMK
jgi:hypothetical protein